jgi:hypothetical protein
VGARSRDGRRRILIRLLVIAVIAFAGRAAYVLLETQHHELPLGLVGGNEAARAWDEEYYEKGAHRLADGRGFRFVYLGLPGDERAEHPPLASVALAPAALVSDSTVPMRLTVAFTGAVVVFLIGLCGLAVGGPTVATVAAVLAAIYPNLWMNDGLIMAETFAALGVAGTVLAAYRLLQRPGVGRAAVLGAACAVAMLSRSELALLVAFVALPTAWLAEATMRRRARLAGVVVVAALVPVAPWVLYNLGRFEEPVLLSNADGDVLLGANCDATYSGPLLGSHAGLCDGERPFPPEASELSAKQRDQAFEYVSDHLDRLPVVVAARIGRMWNVYEPFDDIRRSASEGRPRWAAFAGLFVYWALLPLAVLGTITLLRRQIPVVPLLGAVVLVTLHAALFFGWVRHRVGAEVPLVVLAAVGLVALTGGIRRVTPDAA